MVVGLNIDLSPLLLDVRTENINGPLSVVQKKKKFPTRFHFIEKISELLLVAWIHFNDQSSLQT